MKCLWLLLLLAAYVSGTCRDLLDDPGFRTMWSTFPRTFLTSSSEGTPVTIPDGGFILLGLSSLSTPRYIASHTFTVPEGVSNLTISTSVQISSKNGFSYTLGLDTETKEFTPNEMAPCAGSRCLLEWTIPTDPTETEHKFILWLNSPASENRWFAITDIQIWGCPPAASLAWWAQALIVCAVLAFLFAIGVLIYHCIGLPGPRKAKRAESKADEEVRVDLL